MPALLDLAGCRYGQLTVLRPNGRLKFGHEQTAWLCRCDCGTEITVPQNRFPHRASISSRHAVTACPECRRPRCVICGEVVRQGSLTRETCSEACAKARRKQIQNASYHRRVARNPDLNKRRAARVKARAKADPVFAARLAEQTKAAQERRKARIKTDPACRETVLARQRNYYAKHAAEIQARRRARLDAMTLEQREPWLERMRRYGRAYRQRWRQELKANPARHREYLDWMREYRRQRHKQKQTTERRTLPQ
jgi:hypothetical protein